jgi:hypothetical protein
MLIGRDRVGFGVPGPGDATPARPERFSRPLDPLGLEAGRWRRLRRTLIARWHAAKLDRRLAAGDHPSAGTLLAVRGQQITSRRSRTRVADGLARAVSDSVTTPVFSAAVQPDRREVLAARAVLAVLDRRLRAPEPVTAQGVALLRELLTDGAGPLYRRSERGALGSRLRAAAAALEPRGRG